MAPLYHRYEVMTVNRYGVVTVHTPKAQSSQDAAARVDNPNSFIVYVRQMTRTHGSINIHVNTLQEAVHMADERWQQHCKQNGIEYVPVTP